MIGSEKMLEVKMGVYGSLPGSFGWIADDVVRWTSCRETFHRRLSMIGDMKTLDVEPGFYDASSGAFGWYVTAKEMSARNGRIASSIGWTTCRETFHDTSHTKYIMNIGMQTLERFNSFVSRVEGILGFIGANGSLFSKIKGAHNNIWIEPIQWWFDIPMRHQFFTCCLRAAMTYKGDNFFQTLYGFKYFSPVPYATSRFLDGYTRYTGNTRGWYSAMGDQDRATVDRLLIKP